MALSLKSIWKYLGNVSDNSKAVLTTDYHYKQEPSRLRKWLKCLFLGHDKAPEIRAKRAWLSRRKRHYYYCKCCGKRWYED